MDLLRESYVKEYQRQEQLAGLELKRQINEALADNQQRSHILAQIGHFLHALGNARKIRIEVHFDYNDPQPKATGC